MSRNLMRKVEIVGPDDEIISVALFDDEVEVYVENTDTQTDARIFLTKDEVDIFIKALTTMREHM